mgnify:CR=1 FL=1
MHRIAAKLLALSLAVPALGACRTVCHTPIHERRTTLTERSEGAAAIVAATYAELGLKGGSRSYPAAECVAACGPKAARCEVTVRFEGPPGRPTSSEGTVVCKQAGEAVCHEDFDPLNLGTCPYGCGRLPALDAEALTRLLGAFPTGEGGASPAPHATPLALEVGRIAALEALSVGAFAQVARDLARLGLLSRELEARLASAQRDERRHARAARAVLRGLGAGAPRAPRVPRGAAGWRGLEEVAVGNAVEGCVRESFGAVVACVQARTAGDPTLRAFFRAIAVDELRHAALSWDLHALLMGRLTAAARRRVQRAQRVALSELARGPEPHAEVRARAGAPSRRARAALVQAMRATLPFREAA